ncbi:hypothetical protein GCM10009839_31340 [Catenulispora yoronensis]|uniref:AB hydrolase-1 domain-containing protein n=1 Tax=Catenulispora yoronensis TaxID=450799 RepID=A0ABP5FNZ3_9ACTN
MSPSPSPSPLLILVHSPLVGPSTWRPVAEALNAGGFEARTPSLLGLAGGPGPYAARFAEAVVAKADAAVAAGAAEPGGGIVLAAHSGAGAHLPAIAEAVARSGAGPVLGAAFVDARLPRPGRSDFDTSPPEFADTLTAMARDGLVPPWNEWFPPETLASLIPDEAQREVFLAELHPVALAYFQEPAPATPTWPDVPCAYLQLSETYQDQADQAASLGWLTSRLPAHHLAVLTDPGPVAVFLSEFAQSLAID